MFQKEILNSLPDGCRLEELETDKFKIFLNKNSFLNYNFNDLEFDGGNPKPKTLVEFYKGDQLLYTLEMIIKSNKPGRGHYNYIISDWQNNTAETIGDRFQNSILTFTREVSNKIKRGEFNV